MREGDAIATPGATDLATDHESVWVAGGAQLVRIELRKDPAVVRIPIRATVVGSGPVGTWVISGGRLVRIDRTRNRAQTAGALRTDASLLAVTSRAVWTARPGSSRLVRIRAGDGARRLVELGDAGTVVGRFGIAGEAEAVWVLTDRGRLVHVDGPTGAARSTPSRGAATAVAAGGRAWTGGTKLTVVPNTLADDRSTDAEKRVGVVADGIDSVYAAPLGGTTIERVESLIAEPPQPLTRIGDVADVDGRVRDMVYAGGELWVLVDDGTPASARVLRFRPDPEEQV